MSHNFKNWPIVTGLTLVTIPILFMYVFLFVDTVTDTRPGEMIPNDGGPGSSTEVWALSAYHTALDNYWGNLQYGYGAALALVLVLVGVIMSLIYLRFFRFNELVKTPRIEQ